jgi:hypothetical protein
LVKSNATSWLTFLSMAAHRCVHPFAEFRSARDTMPRGERPAVGEARPAQQRSGKVGEH